MRFSVVIPAHNEAKYIGRCISSIRAAERGGPDETEIVVVCNRCTDATAEIAAQNGAVVVENQDFSIARVRNAGIAAALGEVIVTIDADNRMTPGTLSEIDGLLRGGTVIGGGAPMRFERYSFPLWLNDMLCRASFRLTGLYCGIMWAERATFDAIGGFVDQKAMEDAATAKRLKAYGKRIGKRYGVLRRNHLINSTRKFDEMGDWLYFRLMFGHIGTFLKAAFGDRTGLDQLLDELFYHYNDRV